jgi:hypothetical protein
MVEQSTNLQDFLILVPCCGVLLFVALTVGGILLMLHLMGKPKPPAST